MSSMRASLPMYDLAELRDATDRLWSDVRAPLLAAGIDAPQLLTRPDHLHEHWLDADVLLSQTCGWPLVTELVGRVRVVGTFRYDVDGADGTSYRSRIVMRGDGRSPEAALGGVAAVNDLASLSGWVSLVRAFPQLDGRWRGAVRLTGSHAGSVAAVAAGDADVASIDAVTWALLARHRPDAVAGLVVVGEGPTVPCLPLITTAHADEHVLRCLQAALVAAVTVDRDHPTRAELAIAGFVPASVDTYRAVRALGVDDPADVRS